MRRVVTLAAVASMCVFVLGGSASAAASFTRATLTASGEAVAGDHELAAMTADGRYVLFHSPGAFVAGDTNGVSDAYVKDTATGAVDRISVSSGGSGSIRPSIALDISNDGRFVVFWTGGQLVPNVTDGLRHYYVRDRQLGTTELVDVTYNGAEAVTSATGLGGSISDDGRYVAFRSRGGNILPGMTNLCQGCGYLYVRDRQNQTTVVGSQGPSGNISAAASSRVDLSDDGRYLTWISGQNHPSEPDGDLVPEDTNGLDDVYRRDLQTGAVDLVSVDSSGFAAGNSGVFAVSADARFVAFHSLNAVLDATTPGVYLRDFASGTTTRLPVPVDFTMVPSLSAGGDALAYFDPSTTASSGAGVYVLRLASNSRDFVTSATARASALSADGSRLAFQTNASLTPDDTTGQQDVYLANLSAGPVDADGDGIDDAIDTGDRAFHDGGTTAGTVGPLPAGVSVLVSDLPDPQGVHVTVSGSGTGEVTIDLTNPVSGAPCGTVRLAAGSSVDLTCGSITVGVAAGKAEIVLSDDTSLFVGAGEIATVSISTNGSFVVNAVSGGDGKLVLTNSGTSTLVGPSSTPINLWDFAGFSSPVDNPPVFNVGKAGSNVPLKWRLLSETGAPVTNLSGASISTVTVTCDEASIDALEETVASPSALQNLGDGYYQLNWKTEKSWTGCRQMRLSLSGEGPIVHEAMFKFK